ncbi:hypothetical protein [Streptomyces sp. TRM64462]|uniref:hypothetical protein n=1 Tax=Streptomyces sp. TRM64462 TaxID=2741726 RepID=UPI001585F2C5|nr:hypothetical protein [Streptomyces sp. TRM64462]
MSDNVPHGSAGARSGGAPIVVTGVVPADPPYRLVEVRGEVAGAAQDILDVIRLAHRAGLAHVDLDDPAVVRWVGGGKYKWAP